MKKFQKNLFYLLVLLLPTQLGRHFFFDFSQISGIVIDYLVPTVYLTDIIVFFIITVEIYKKIKNQKSKIKSTVQSSKVIICFLLFFIFYLLSSVVFNATSKWIAFYKLVKIIEFVLLGFVVVKLKPNFLTTLLMLGFGMIYTSVVAVWQFVLQRSIGGIFWWLGERSFYVSTPGIARFSLGGRLLLRPYATFSHPNVMGGFLAVVLPIFLYILRFNKKYVLSVISNLFRDPVGIPESSSGQVLKQVQKDKEPNKQLSLLVSLFFLLAFLSGLLVLFLSFSRAAWTVAFIGFLLIIFREINIFDWLKRHKAGSILIFYTLFLLSITLPLVLLKTFSINYPSLKERTVLIGGGLKLFLESPIFGVGLNNSIIKLYKFIDNASSFYIFQPIHNVYLLLLVETGLVGFLLFITALVIIYRAVLSRDFMIALGLTQILLLSFFDHYFFTLQQTQLLFTVFVSLALSKTKTLVLPGRKS